MKFSFMQNPLTQILFFAWIYNSFIISHLLEWLKVLQIKNGIRVNFDQCVNIWLMRIFPRTKCRTFCIYGPFLLKFKRIYKKQ